MTKIVVIDGQGGKMGRLVIEQLKASAPAGNYRITAIGTNSIATANMLKAGADNGATGENPVVVNCRDADIVVGPVGIIAADALQGEVTSAMAVSVGSCHAQKVLLPISRCRISVMGMAQTSAAELVSLAVGRVAALIGENENA